jgi:hypothetical protein
VQLVTDFYANVFAFLHAHHEGEDSALIPLLLERSTETELITRVAAQHDDILPPLAACEQALESWHDAPDASTGAALEASIAALVAVVTPHLDEEESAILPICAAHLTAAEWGSMPGHTLRAFSGDKVWLILGLIREQMTEQQKATMLANMPPPAVEMWTTMGNAALTSSSPRCGIPPDPERGSAAPRQGRPRTLRAQFTVGSVTLSERRRRRLIHPAGRARGRSSSPTICSVATADFQSKVPHRTPSATPKIEPTVVSRSADPPADRFLRRGEDLRHVCGRHRVGDLGDAGTLPSLPAVTRQIAWPEREFRTRSRPQLFLPRPSTP